MNKIAFSLGLTVLGVAVLLPFAPAARADTIDVFQLNASLPNGGTADGTVSIDITTGQFTGEDVVYTSDHGAFAFDEVNPTTVAVGGFVYAIFTDPGASALLEINATSLVGYSGGGLCTLANPCPSNNASNFGANSYAAENLTAGTLTLTTPEPASVALLSIALFALGVRRLRTAALCFSDPS